MKLRLEIFEAGIGELELFFKGFKPNVDQLAAWFKRVKHFTEDEFRLAIYRITEDSKLPSYEVIKTQCFEARKTLSPKQSKVPRPQGFAPESHEQKLFTQSCMKLLLIALEQKASKTAFAELFTIWNDGYKRLPDYKSEAEVKRLIEQQRWSELVSLGFIQAIPNEPPKPYIPSFENERRNTVIEVG